jgi:hypothetical protein
VGILQLEPEDDNYNYKKNEDNLLKIAEYFQIFLNAFIHYIEDNELYRREEN